ncbi:MAG: GrpB family protein [Thermoleophilaceae bacterium]
MGDEVQLIGGQERRAIQVVAYNPAWAARFEHERQRIAAALGAGARRIDHIGSTAVPGLAAKPIIDIDLSVDDPDDERAYVPALEYAGYRLRVREPGHRCLRTPTLDVHVHVCAAGSDWEVRHLLLRDWLRTDPRDRTAYAALKQDLARRDWSDMNAYAAAKCDLIQQITDRAKRWAAATGWRPD